MTETTAEDLNWRICIIPNSFQVSNTDTYWVDDIKGWQVCPQFCVWDSTRYDYTISNNDTNPFGKYMSERIPISLFLGKNDGDIIELKHKGKVLKVKIDQEGTKWKYTFKDLLLDVSESFGGCYSPHEGDLSKSFQRALLATSYIKVCESYDIAPRTEFEKFRYFNSKW